MGGWGEGVGGFRRSGRWGRVANMPLCFDSGSSIRRVGGGEGSPFPTHSASSSSLHTRRPHPRAQLISISDLPLATPGYGEELKKKMETLVDTKIKKWIPEAQLGKRKLLMIQLGMKTR